MSNRSSHPAGPGAQRDSADDGFSGFEEDPLVELARIVSEGNSRFHKEAPRPVEPRFPDEPEVEAESAFAEDSAYEADADFDSPLSAHVPEERASLVDHEAWARDLEDGLARDLGFQVGSERAPEPAMEEALEPLPSVDDPDFPDSYGADVYSVEPGSGEHYAHAPYDVAPAGDVRYADEEAGHVSHVAGFPEESGYHQDYVQEEAAAPVYQDLSDPEHPHDVRAQHGDEEPLADAEPAAYEDEGVHAGGAYERALEEAVAASLAARQLSATGEQENTLRAEPQPQPQRTLTDDLAASLENEFLTQPASPRRADVFDDGQDQLAPVQAQGWPQGASWEEPAFADDAGSDQAFDDDFLLQSADTPAHASVSARGYEWADEPAYAEDPYAHDDPEAPPPPGGYDLDAVAQAMREGDPHLGGHGVLPPHSEAELEAAPAQGKSRRGLVVAATVMGIVVLGGGAFALLDLGGGAPDGPPPIITASDAPVKEFPENEERPGNGASKLIYDRVGGSEGTGEERLVLRDETPVASLPPAPAGQAAGENGTIVPSGPRRVRTVVVRPDGTIISGNEAANDTQSGSSQVQAGTAGQTQGQPRTLPGATAGLSSSGLGQGQEAANAGEARTVSTSPVSAAQSGNGNDAAGQSSQTSGATDNPSNVPRIKPEDIQTLARAAAPPPAASAQPVAPRQQSTAPLDLTARSGQQAPAATQPAARATSASATVPAGAYVVQVSSQRSEQQAQTAFDDLQRRFGSVLGGVSPVIQRADLGDRGTFYRVRIPTSSRDEAISLCERLKTAGGDCFVRRN